MHEHESSFMYVLALYVLKLLNAHEIDSDKDFHMELSLSPHPDLIVERSDDVIFMSTNLLQ